MCVNCKPDKNIDCGKSSFYLKMHIKSMVQESPIKVIFFLSSET